MSCFLSDYDQLFGFKATLLFPSLSLSCELVLRSGVSSSEFLGENEESRRVKHISTDTDTCPMWDHPTHAGPPPPPPPQLFSCSQPLYTEWVSLFLPPPLLFTHSLHPLTQTFHFPTFSFLVQNDRNCQTIVQMCVCVCEGREDYSCYQRHFCTWCFTELHLPFPSPKQQAPYKMDKGETRNSTISSPLYLLLKYLYLSASSPFHSIELTSLHLLHNTLSPRSLL